MTKQLIDLETKTKQNVSEMQRPSLNLKKNNKIKIKPQQRLVVKQVIQ